MDRDSPAALPAEDHSNGDHRAGVDGPGRPPALQPWPRQTAEQEQGQAAGQGGEVDETRARRPLGPGDHAVAPGMSAGAAVRAYRKKGSFLVFGRPTAWRCDMRLSGISETGIIFHRKRSQAAPKPLELRRDVRIIGR